MIKILSYSATAAIAFYAATVFAKFVDVSYLRILILSIFSVAVPFSYALVTKIVKNRSIWIVFVAPLFFMTGWLVTEVRTDTSLRPLYPYMGMETEIHGTICSLPVKYEENTVFIIETAYVKTDRPDKVREKIKVSTDGFVPEPGASVVIKGELKPVSLPRNTTSFDSNRYNKRRGIFFSVFTQDIKVSEEKYNLSVSGKIRLFINSSTDLFINRFPSYSIALLKAMVLNNKSEIPDEVIDAMLRSGTYRYLYCPYLHIGFLIFMLGKIFGEKKSGVYAGICIFLIYLFMNISVPSAWKICLVFAFSYILTTYLSINDIKIPMYLTVIFTGFISPLTLTEPGFVISVTATILVRCFNNPLGRFLYFITHNRKISGILSIYLIIMVGIYPISSFYGFGITPWSMLLGMFMMPLVILVYVMFYISYALFLLTGTVWNMGVPLLVLIIEKVSQGASNLPFAKINFGSCSILFVVTFYLFLFCVYKRICKKRRRKAEKLTILLCIVLISLSLYGINDTELVFLSVGNADCAVISFPWGKTMMVDGGGSEYYSSYDMGRAEVIPYLEANGINKIDTVILSHYDKDHADGIVTVMKHMHVKEIFAPDYLPKNQYRDIIEAEAKKKKTKINYISSPCTVKPLSGGKCEFLSDNADTEGNDGSLVARITLGKTRVLFAGDISSFAEYKLPDTKSDIVKVPHHGSKYSSSESFIKATDADYGVICAGENNPYGHPSSAVLSRYADYGTEILRTDLLGDIHFVIGRNRIKRIYGFRERFIYGGF